MLGTGTSAAIGALAMLASTASAQKCQSSIQAVNATLVAKGFTARVIANGLVKPRGIVIDKNDNLLVVDRGKGVMSYKIKDNGGCVSLDAKRAIIENEDVNHGIALTADQSRLFVSSKMSVYSFAYKDGSVTGVNSTWVVGMNQTGHATRTLVLSKKVPGMLLVSRGSGPNIDDLARDIKTGVSQIRAFNISGEPKAYNYTTDGKIIAWGLRNSVGLAENPADGGIWSNENSGDYMGRDNVTIKEDSPAEEINYHGDLSSKFETHGKNYGYPECATAWSPETIPRNASLKVGTQFTYNATSPGITDQDCVSKYIAPKVTLPSHWAPLDIAFNSKGTVAYMTSHGSWNKKNPDGYRIFAITFANGQPTHPPTSKTAHIPILLPTAIKTCGKGDSKCFRPVGLAFDSKGRLYMTSDSTGEIYVITRTDGRSVDASSVEELEALERTEPPRIMAEESEPSA